MRLLLSSIAVILAIILGILLGLIISIISTDIPVTTIREDKRSIIPVIMITGVQDGNIIGTMRGNVRFFISDDQVLPSASGSFTAPAGSLLKNLTMVKVPAGMQYVASKRGKKYYPVTSRSAASLAPANRVYFKDVEAAEAAGYAP